MCMDLDDFQQKTMDKVSDCAKRKKLWQLDPPFLCNIIGTCLTLAELKRLSRKMRITLQTAQTDYELHRAFVEIASTQSHSSRYLHKYLDQRYRDNIRYFAKAENDTELERFWDEAVKAGDIAGPLWALVTQSRAPTALVDRMYGEVHMLSHLAGATVRVDMQELNQLRQQTRTLTRQLATMQVSAKVQSKAKENQIKQLEKRLIQSEGAVQELEAVREQLSALESDLPMRRLQQNVEDLTAMLQDEQGRTERAEAEAESLKKRADKHADRLSKLEIQLAESQAERTVLEATLEKLLSPDLNGPVQQKGILREINLCGRCVLYVGGRNRQCALFRALVERQNGQFIHHDGGLEDSRSRLGSILPQADVVLCPLDCVSHDAANRVKQFCKRNGKRFVFLPRSSLAAFARGLNEQAA